MRRGQVLDTPHTRRTSNPTPGYTVTGTVVEKGTRTPLAGIFLRLIDPQTGKAIETITAEHGVYHFEGAPPGVLTLEIVTGEHAPFSRPVYGRPPGTEEIAVAPVYLDPVGVPRYRTIVKDPHEKVAASEIHLSGDELTRVPGTFGDPTRVVATLPGVARTPFGIGYYIVRGASFENTGFFIDGHPALYTYYLVVGPGLV